MAHIAWSADGRAMYVITSTPAPEERRLWLVDTSGATPPVSVRLDFVPVRVDAAPNGSAIFLLGGQSSESGTIPGSGFLAIYDPKTLAERVRVPLSGLNIGPPSARGAPLQPAVALAPDGSRYYVAHADRPVIDVVDIRAPRLERLERTISLRDTPSQTGSSQAWLGVSPDGAHLFTWRHVDSPDDDLGLQVIDVHTWQVQTLDPIATRIGSSLNGQWLFELDPPAISRPGAAPRQQRGPRDFSGARLSVLDAATRTEVAVLERDEFSFGVGQYGPDRLYVMQFGGRDAAGTLIAYDTASWSQIARRPLETPGWLATTSPLW
jgi:hypothetical protein